MQVNCNVTVTLFFPYPFYVAHILTIWQVVVFGGEGGAERLRTGSAYAGIVYSSIKPYFRGDNRFIGKVCDIKMEISSDGTILSYEKKSGPNDLCAAALNAISQAKKMRRAPTPEEYQMFKSFTLGFDPRKVR